MKREVVDNIYLEETRLLLFDRKFNDCIDACQRGTTLIKQQHFDGPIK